MGLVSVVVPRPHLASVVNNSFLVITSSAGHFVCSQEKEKRKERRKERRKEGRKEAEKKQQRQRQRQIEKKKNKKKSISLPLFVHEKKTKKQEEPFFDFVFLLLINFSWKKKQKKQEQVEPHICSARQWAH